MNLQDSSTDFSKYDLSNFYYGSGADVSDLVQSFNAWWKDAEPGGYDLYQEQLQSSPENHVLVRSNQTGEIGRLINLSSFNYLGMSTSPEVKQASIAALEKYGLGSAGGPILSGTFGIHRELEAAIAKFKKTESCLLFPSGYAANIGIISGLMRSGDHVFLDQFSHASIVDGAILSKAKTVFFRHNNAVDLDRKLTGISGRKLVVIEGIYSMDGDFCDLPALVEVAKKHQARILIDEAHSAFICGPTGRGVAEYYGLESEVDLHMGTLSKALGGLGGYVCASNEFIQYLNAYARSRFFSTTLPPAIAAGVLAAFKQLEAKPEIRKKLWSNINWLQDRFKKEGFDTGNSVSQIIPVMLRSDKKAFSIAQKIRERGIFLQPVTYPGVPKGKSRLRVSISSNHAIEDLETATRAIAEVLREEGIL